MAEVDAAPSTVAAEHVSDQQRSQGAVLNCSSTVEQHLSRKTTKKGKTKLRAGCPSRRTAEARLDPFVTR